MYCVEKTRRRHAVWKMKVATFGCAKKKCKLHAVVRENDPDKMMRKEIGFPSRQRRVFNSIVLIVKKCFR